MSNPSVKIYQKGPKKKLLFPVVLDMLTNIIFFQKRILAHHLSTNLVTLPIVAHDPITFFLDDNIIPDLKCAHNRHLYKL